MPEWPTWNHFLLALAAIALADGLTSRFAAMMAAARSFTSFKSTTLFFAKVMMMVLQPCSLACGKSAAKP